MNTPNVITRRTRRPLDQVCARLPEVAQQHRFGVLGTHDLKEKMVSKGVPFERECRVYEVCNPQQAKSVLEHEMDVATALPCRIAVYQDGAETVLATLKPTMLLGLFGTEPARGAAAEVERVITEIMDGVCQTD